MTATSAATPHDRIVAAAADLLADGGAAAVTTRAVADAAGVKAPTIYRLFGDKDGLLEAVAEHVMATHVAAKAEREQAAAAAGSDPVADLRASWHAQVEFGLAHPALFRLLGDPARTGDSPAYRAGLAVLEGRVHRVAATGRLRVAEPVAVDLVRAAGAGVVQVLLTTPLERRDPALAELALDAVLARILTPDPAAPTDDGAGLATAAVTLRARAAEAPGLGDAERALLAEWLDRVVRASS